MIENGSVVVRKICLKFKDRQMDDSDDKSGKNAWQCWGRRK